MESKSVRPFLRSAKVIPRGWSRALQRAITDFAADQPFAQMRMKLQEHYGFEIGESTIQIAPGPRQDHLRSEPSDPGFS
ncbi:MAG: hypothetical protein WA836_09390 [Candidatus Binataceae bacterium]